MIIGTYPCCNGTMAIDIGEGKGQYAPHTCDHCGATVWTRFSRINPETWTDADFRQEFAVDDVKRTVTAKPANV